MYNQREGGERFTPKFIDKNHWEVLTPQKNSGEYIRVLVNSEGFTVIEGELVTGPLLEGGSPY